MSENSETNEMLEKCRAWAKGDKTMTAYHDERWCRPCHDDNELFAWLCLEGQQAGLSWSVIMKREKDIREAFGGFDIGRVAAYDDVKKAKVLSHKGVIKNKGKIESAVKNARAILKMKASGEWKSFDEYIWHFTDGRQVVHHLSDPSEMPAESVLSREVAKDMKKRGFTFVGPVIIYSYLQAIGVIDDHLDGCPCKAKGNE